MIDIKIVEFKAVEASEKDKENLFCSPSLYEEDKTYTISEYEETFREKIEQDKTLQEKLNFLKAVSLNPLLNGEIVKFQHKFDINNEIPYTKYYDSKETHYRCYKLEKEIPAEQESYIDNISTDYYIHPFLGSILIDLLYMCKVDLSNLNMDLIKIGDAFSCSDRVCIEIYSNDITKTKLAEYIKNNWEEKIKPKVKQIPESLKLKKISSEDLLIYELHYEKHKSPTCIYNENPNIRERFADPNTLGAYCSQIKTAILSIFHKNK